MTEALAPETSRHIAEAREHLLKASASLKAARSAQFEEEEAECVSLENGVAIDVDVILMAAQVKIEEALKLAAEA